MTQERNRLTTQNDNGDEFDISIEEANKLYSQMNEAHILQLGRTPGKSEPYPRMMIISTPNGPYDESMAKRLMEGLEKSPWEFVPNGHPDLPVVNVEDSQSFTVALDQPMPIPNSSFVPQPPIWGHPQIVSDDSELAKLVNKMRLDDINVDFAAQVVNNNKAFNDHIIQNAAAIYGISPGLLVDTAQAESALTTNDLLRDHIAKWGVQMAEHLKPMIGKGVQALARDLLISIRKTVKTKRHHRNVGSMRQRRMRYYFNRVDKDVSVSETLYKNAYPVSMGDFVEMPDGKIEMNIEFRYNEPLSPEPVSAEVAMRAYQGPDGRLDITSFDLINKGPYANPSTPALDVQSDTQT